MYTAGIPAEYGRKMGAESKVNVLRWGQLSGFVSYSYMVGSAYFPVTGGLFQVSQQLINSPN